MHDVAWRGMWICVRSKDAQKQLARTFLIHSTNYFQRLTLESWYTNLELYSPGRSNNTKNALYARYVFTTIDCSSFSTDILVYVIKHVELIKAKKDHVIVRQGEKGNW